MAIAPYQNHYNKKTQKKAKDFGFYFSSSS
jgi:hypothetical protein